VFTDIVDSSSIKDRLADDEEQKNILWWRSISAHTIL